jgi:hypothetical protein
MSDSFLSQEEVDALLEGVTGESQKSTTEEVEAGIIRQYDISSQERIVRGRMPTAVVAVAAAAGGHQRGAGQDAQRQAARQKQGLQGGELTLRHVVLVGMRKCMSVPARLDRAVTPQRPIAHQTAAKDSPPSRPGKQL